MTHLLNVPFQEAVMLAGIDLPATDLADQIPITLYWQMIDTLPADFNVSIRLVDQAGEIWGQVDRFPIGGLVRTRSWIPGMVVRDEYLLQPDPGTPPGTYNFDILMYNYKTGEIFAEARHLGYVNVLPPSKVPAIDAVEAVLPVASQAQVTADLALVGHDVVEATLLPGEKHQGRLYWQASTWPQRDEPISLIARHSQGQTFTLLTDTPGPTDYGPNKWRKGELVAETYTFAFPLEAPAGDYDLLVQSQMRPGAGPEVQISTLHLNQPQRNFDLPPDVLADLQPLSAQVGEVVQLLGYHLAQVGDETHLKVYWAAQTPLSENYKVFVHVADAQEAIVAQRDQIPANGARPTSTWLPQEVIVDSYALSIPAGVYNVWLGMYDPNTGSRLPAQSQAPVSADRILLTVLSVPGQ
jgi:hypothetical protein